MPWKLLFFEPKGRQQKRHMEIVTEAAQFLYWEYVNPNFFAVQRCTKGSQIFEEDDNMYCTGIQE
jgi:capsule polysaccharide export protein KpsC/LpsZ